MQTILTCLRQLHHFFHIIMMKMNLFILFFFFVIHKFEHKKVLLKKKKTIDEILFIVFLSVLFPLKLSKKLFKKLMTKFDSIRVGGSAEHNWKNIEYVDKMKIKFEEMENNLKIFRYLLSWCLYLFKFSYNSQGCIHERGVLCVIILNTCFFPS